MDVIIISMGGTHSTPNFYIQNRGGLFLAYYAEKTPEKPVFCGISGAKGLLKTREEAKKYLKKFPTLTLVESF